MDIKSFTAKRITRYQASGMTPERMADALLGDLADFIEMNPGAIAGAASQVATQQPLAAPPSALSLAPGDLPDVAPRIPDDRAVYGSVQAKEIAQSSIIIDPSARQADPRVRVISPSAPAIEPPQRLRRVILPSDVASRAAQIQESQQTEPVWSVPQLIAALEQFPASITLEGEGGKKLDLIRNIETIGGDKAEYVKLTYAVPGDSSGQASAFRDFSVYDREINLEETLFQIRNQAMHLLRRKARVEPAPAVVRGGSTADMAFVVIREDNSQENDRLFSDQVDPSTGGVLPGSASLGRPDTVMPRNSGGGVINPDPVFGSVRTGRIADGGVE